MVDTLHDFFAHTPRWYSDLAHVNSSVLRSSLGDLVLSATAPRGASMHFGTMPLDTTDTTAEQPHDLERMTLWWDGKAAIGTQGIIPAAFMGDSGHTGEYDLFHLHVPCVPLTYTVDPSSGYAVNQLMAMKLSYGGIGDGQLRFAELGFDRGHQLSSFSSDQDLVLSTNFDQAFGPAGSGLGDMIISNRRIGKALRFGTTYDTGETPSTITDAEHLAILSNGNIGIDLPKDTATHLMKPVDQLSIGGGSVAPAGYTTPIPGLSIFGGDWYEGMTRPGGGTYPVDWRGIAFNHWEDHRTGIGSRTAPMSWSGIGFADGSGGLVNISCFPWHTGDSLTDNSGNTTLSLTGTNGLEFWTDDRAIGGEQYHHLFDCWRKGFTGSLGIRNDSGLFFHHTPVYIGGTGDPNFTNLTNVHPSIGDGETWMLAVNGAALFKEAYVNENDWGDYVFLPGYKLMPIEDFGKYIMTEHHLPEIPPADSMAHGVPLGKTEVDLTKQVEELSLYIVQLNKEVTALKAEVEGLKNGKEK